MLSCFSLGAHLSSQCHAFITHTQKKESEKQERSLQQKGNALVCAIAITRANYSVREN